MTTQATKSVGPSSPTLLVSDVDSRRGAQAPAGVLVSAALGNTQVVYLGGADVTTSTGVPLAPGGVVGLELWGADTLYGISASGLQELRLLIGPFVRFSSAPASGGSMTAAEILALLLTVDGSGSSLDADLLDGLQASAFALITNTDGNPGRRIYVGTNTPSTPTPVVGDVWVNT